MDNTFKHYIQNSSNVEFKESEDWWFTRANQQKYIFNIASQLMIHQDYEVSEALDIADDLCSSFHHKYINRSTRKEI